MKPLSVGNIISAGLRIYRDRFKTYYSQAFIAYLWLIVPIYGWAKFCMIYGLIARLAYGEVAEKPESVKDARRYVKPRMWSFLGNTILVSLLSLIGIVVILAIFLFLGFILTSLGLLQNLALQIGLSIVLGTILILAFLYSITWLVSRLMLADLPLAIEDNITATKSISRGWELTKGFVLKLQLVVLLAFLITLPISIVINLLSFVAQFLLTYLSTNVPDLLPIISFLLVLFQIAITFASGALYVPFWQSIKAVIYYDLRVRKEGLGLDLETNK